MQLFKWFDLQYYWMLCFRNVSFISSLCWAIKTQSFSGTAMDSLKQSHTKSLRGRRQASSWAQWAARLHLKAGLRPLHSSWSVDPSASPVVRMEPDGIGWKTWEVEKNRRPEVHSYNCSFSYQNQKGNIISRTMFAISIIQWLVLIMIGRLRKCTGIWYPLCIIAILSHQNGHIQALKRPSSSLLCPGVHSGSPKSEC